MPKGSESSKTRGQLDAAVVAEKEAAEAEEAASTAAVAAKEKYDVFIGTAVPCGAGGGDENFDINELEGDALLAEIAKHKEVAEQMQQKHSKQQEDNKKEAADNFKRAAEAQKEEGKAKRQKRMPTMMRHGGLRANPSKNEQQLELKIETHNITSWGSFSEVLASNEAHLLLVQETHADRNKDQELRAKATRAGWHMISAEAIGKQEGTTGGVAILTRSWLGLSYIDSDGDNNKHEVVPGRVVAAKWQVPGLPPIFVALIYLKTGTGPVKENLGILGKIGEKAALSGMPMVIGGDFNMAPEKLSEIDFTQKMCGVIVASEEGTTKGVEGMIAKLDFFVMDIEMAKSMQEVRAREEIGFQPHRPVTVKMATRREDMACCAFDILPALPKERVYGPMLWPKDEEWTNFELWLQDYKENNMKGTKEDEHVGSRRGLCKMGKLGGAGPYGRDRQLGQQRVQGEEITSLHKYFENKVIKKTAGPKAAEARPWVWAKENSEEHLYECKKDSKSRRTRNRAVFGEKSSGVDQRQPGQGHDRQGTKVGIARTAQAGRTVCPGEGQGGRRGQTLMGWTDVPTRGSPGREEEHQRRVEREQPVPTIGAPVWGTGRECFGKPKLVLPTRPRQARSGLRDGRLQPRRRRTLEGGGREPDFKQHDEQTKTHEDDKQEERTVEEQEDKCEELLMKKFTNQEAEAVRKAVAERQASWQNWAHQALAGGAQRAHSFVKDPTAWVPEEAADNSGIMSSDPRALLNFQVKCWVNLWTK